ncbi:MAG TPA: hypothetical protein VJP60_05470 [Rhizomicrobium sp.]|nr:hypothetical protein [Rhizomicrobium sp.]
MTDTRMFALICWVLWLGLLAFGITKAIPVPLAAGLGVSVFFLWRLYRKMAVVSA